MSIEATGYTQLGRIYSQMLILLKSQPEGTCRINNVKTTAVTCRCYTSREQVTSVRIVLAALK